MADTQKQIVTVGVTGASGAILAQKMLVMLEEDPRVTRIHLVVTVAGQRLFKEGRKLVLCVRDTPFNRVHLENMLRAQQAGVVILPAVPAFYHQPKTIDDLVTQYVCRVLAQIGLSPEKMYHWTGTPASKKAEA